MSLLKRLLALRNSPLLLRIPPYLSALCIVVGVAWLLLLPLNDLSRSTYISENAILPGQVHTYFGGSEHLVFRAFRQEVFALASQDDAERTQGLEKMLRDSGLKTGSQSYSWTVAGERVAVGTNVYGVLHAPRADATEAMALVAAWRNFDGELNYSGVALALTLARYFRRWSIWSKDIIVLIPNDSVYGPVAWLSAYHSTEETATSTRNISALPLKAGALQAAVALDYPAGPWGQRFDKLDIVYDGINGALPNLDLLNTAISVASGQLGIDCSLHNINDHDDSYHDRFLTMAKGVVTQTFGHATGPHSAFMPYHIDAITLKTTGDGWHDEMSLGRTAESMFRSINNLLEHLHQSFFFYILLGTHRFTSIGNYLPAAMIMAGSFTITALALWFKSGRVADAAPPTPTAAATSKKGVPYAPSPRTDKQQNNVRSSPYPPSASRRIERKMFLPVVVLLAVHLAGIVPLYLLNSMPFKYLNLTFHAIVVVSFVLPLRVGTRLASISSSQQIQILQSLSLLFLGATLSTLATLNFSLAFVIGILCCPLSFIRPLPSLPVAVTRDNARRSARSLAVYIVTVAFYILISPFAALYALHWQLNGFQSPIGITLLEMAKGMAYGAWSTIAIWGIWWPSWTISGIVLFSGVFRSRITSR